MGREVGNPSYARSLSLGTACMFLLGSFLSQFSVVICKLKGLSQVRKIKNMSGSKKYFFPCFFYFFKDGYASVIESLAELSRKCKIWNGQ